MHTKRTTCRICDGRRIQRFLTLGPMPLANSFLRSPEEFAAEPSFALDVYYCQDCTLVQLIDVVDREALFHNCLYVKRLSRTLSARDIEFARGVVEELRLGPDDLVVEAGSGDGGLLAAFQRHGVRTLGVEPATALASMSREAGMETFDKFFDEHTATELAQSHGRAKAIIAHYVLAHVDDPRGFLRGCRHVLAPAGRVVIQVAYLRDLVEQLQYDTIYHEHHCYFAATTLVRLCDAVGLRVQNVERIPAQGGSLRLWLCGQEERAEHVDSIRALMHEERAAGLTESACYERFAGEVEQSRAALVELLNDLQRQGRSIAAYGAPAKGNTLLNYCRIDTKLVAFTVDKNPLKVGTYTPGMHIPVLPASALRERRPDYVLLLPWNLADEIIAQERDYLAAGGRFIIPIPMARVV